MKNPSARTADILLTGGRVFTANPHQPRAEAVAVRGNRIVGVGSAAGLSNLAGRATRVVELNGRFVCPGFVDAHVHLLMAGLAVARPELSACADREALIERVRPRVAAAGEGAWVVGHGWDQERFGTWPHREWLDEAFGDRPIVLYRVDSHAAWVSTAALKAAGISSETADPPGGQIVRDEEGVPTGVLKETAVSLVESVIPTVPPAERREAIEAALAELRRNGITTVHDMSDPSCVYTCRDLRQEGHLTVRVNAWSALTQDLSLAEELREQFPPADPMIRCETLKGFLDGTLGASTAALMEPYADDPSTSGALLWQEEELSGLIRKAHRAGFQLALHAVGDRATHLALSALDGLGAGGRTRRHRIEHAEVLSPGDLARFLSTGAVASMQPGQLLSDSAWLEKRLGPGRLARVFSWRELLNQGSPVLFGTDWPIEPLDPIRTLHAAVAPLEALGPTAGGNGRSWRAGRQLAVGEALTAMTRSGAWATFEDHIKGSLEAGRLADITVLTEDPSAIPVDEIQRVKVDMTIFDGRIVYTRE